MFWRCSKFKSDYKCKASVLTSGDQLTPGEEDEILKSKPHSDSCQHNHPVEEIETEKKQDQRTIVTVYNKGIERKRRGVRETRA